MGSQHPREEGTAAPLAAQGPRATQRGRLRAFPRTAEAANYARHPALCGAMTHRLLHAHDDRQVDRRRVVVLNQARLADGGRSSGRGWGPRQAARKQAAIAPPPSARYHQPRPFHHPSGTRQRAHPPEPRCTCCMLPRHSFLPCWHVIVPDVLRALPYGTCREVSLRAARMSWTAPRCFHGDIHAPLDGPATHLLVARQDVLHARRAPDRVPAVHRELLAIGAQRLGVKLHRHLLGLQARARGCG